MWKIFERLDSPINVWMPLLLLFLILNLCEISIWEIPVWSKLQKSQFYFCNRSFVYGGNESVEKFKKKNLS